MILESTTYPGTTEELVAPILEEGSGLIAGEDFHLGYSPERIDPGNPTWTLISTPKVVSGIDDAVPRRRRRLLRPHRASGPCRSRAPSEAELTKLLENTFRHVNIALVNEMAMFAGDLGIDVWEAIDAASTKPFGYMRFTPGPGVGGHCLPIDPSYLSWTVRRSLGRVVPVRRAGQRRQRPHARLRRPPPGARPSTGWASPSRARGCSLLGPRLQAQHRRRPRGARGRPSPSSLADLGADVQVADPHLAPTPSGPFTLVDLDAPTSSPRPTPWSS